MPWSDRMSLTLRRRQNCETSLTLLLDLITGREDWLGGQVGRSHEMEEEERGIGTVWQDIFVLWRRSRV